MIGDPAPSPFLGLYVPPFPPDGEALDEVERDLGARADVILFYQAWGSRHAAFRRDWLDAIVARGRTPLLTWEPWRLPDHRDDADDARAEAPAAASASSPTSGSTPRPEDQPAWALARILDGEYDAYIDTFARGLADLDAEVWLRPMHEMNGCWYPWAGMVNGNAPEMFIRAWRHLHTRVCAAGATRVRWVFSPHASSHPGTPENAPAAYYPGDDVVDLVGIDAYNWHGVQDDAAWTSLESLVTPALAEVRRVSSRPVFIAETACPPDPRRATWIEEAWGFVRREGLTGLVWFHADKECDWRLTGDRDSAHALTGRSDPPRARRGTPRRG